jgi:hypothetical protein
MITECDVLAVVRRLPCGDGSSSCWVWRVTVDGEEIAGGVETEQLLAELRASVAYVTARAGELKCKSK